MMIAEMPISNCLLKHLPSDIAATASMPRAQMAHQAKVTSKGGGWFSNSKA
jgi:hypothetical protein